MAFICRTGQAVLKAGLDMRIDIRRNALRGLRPTRWPRRVNRMHACCPLAVEAEPRRTGRLAGHIGDEFFDPLSEEELSAWAGQ